MNTNHSNFNRRFFIKTSGLAVAGLGLPATLLSQPDSPQPNPQEDKASPQQLPLIEYDADYVVVGGGIAGACSAITAARAGLKVILIQDRPVLGGNASSEVRLWILGATCHMGNNNRWAREGGVHEEIIVENMYRNKEGNPVFFDALLIEKVWAEPNITLLLNTAVYSLEMDGSDKIRKVFAFCSQNSTHYEISAPLFCDTSGDGIVGFLSGATFRMNAEKGEEFGEKFIMPKEFGELLGHSMYFYSKDVGHPVKYVAPAFAFKDIPAKIPHRYKGIKRDSSGCHLWWLEWGGDLHRVFDSEKIKDELWRMVYGVWDYIKNSGTFKDVDNLTLEWVSTIPGKRESRRFEGDYMLKQQDIIEQTHFDDAIAHGGWALDLHPSAGMYSSYPACTHHHSKGVYTIPYRCVYSRNVSNLFLGGRIISVSHVAFGSTRVISTGTMCAQAAAYAAVLCRKYGILPREIHTQGHIGELQRLLVQSGQYIPTVHTDFPSDLVNTAKVTVSGTLELSALPENGNWTLLKRDTAMLLPFAKGKLPQFTFTVKTETPTTFKVAFYLSKRLGNYTPDNYLAEKEYTLSSGTTSVDIDFGLSVKEAQYGLVVIRKNDFVSVAQSDIRLTGIMPLFLSGHQKRNEQDGVDEIYFFTPERRPNGKNLAIQVKPALKPFGVEQMRKNIFRPASNATNAWVAPLDAEMPSLKCEWKQTQTIRSVILWFDTDFDHAMESCLRGHPENVMPYCVQQYKILNDAGQTIYEVSDNHHSRNEIRLEKPVRTSSLTIQLSRPGGNVPVSLLGIQAFG
ncbi:hypothetical protein FACS189454_01440 [Planctomycetales bacterium]|nr:hypothetical protein FACS189454_01440 [Planctomycetales bacterium]